MKNLPAHAQFNTRRVGRIVAALRRGATRAGAASCAGIAPRTLYDWLRLGKQGVEPYAALWSRVQIEQDAWEDLALKRIHDAIESGAWQAAAWLLERRKPEQYARKDRTDDKKIDELVEKRLREMLDHAETEARRRQDELNAGRVAAMLEAPKDETK